MWFAVTHIELQATVIDGAPGRKFPKFGGQLLGGPLWGKEGGTAKRGVLYLATFVKIFSMLRYPGSCCSPGGPEQGLGVVDFALVATCAERGREGRNNR